MTTLGTNIFAVAVQGDFDVCQALAKRVLNDTAFAQEVFGDTQHITSANSISLGRLLPQIVFPFYALSQTNSTRGEQIVLSIPSGNFGDMMGSVIAKHMGLPVEKIVCGVNENKVFTEFLITGNYNIEPAVYSPSSAMIVSHPSNVARLIDLYGGHISDVRDQTGKVLQAGVIDQLPDMDALRRDIFSCSVSNTRHFETMSALYAKHGITIEPHGAVGFEALELYREQFDSRTHAIVYETADPAKFSEDVHKAIKLMPEVPPQILKQEKLPERIHVMKQDSFISPLLGKSCSDEQYEEFCAFLKTLQR
jgi:threonine synthase